MLKGCLWVVGIVGGLALLGFIYLVLNPPFGNSETGYLSASRKTVVTLTPDEPAAAFNIRVQPSPGIYTTQYPFDPLLVTASLVSGADSPAVLRVYPADDNPVGDLRMTDDALSAAWRLQCDDAENVRGGVPEERPGSAACPREYLVVVAAPALSRDVDLSLELFAEQTFPDYVDTPFLVSIGLEADRVELSGDARLLTGETSGSVRLSASSPVAHYRLLATDPAAGEAAGTLLTLTTDRSADPLPAGLLAPAPLRVAVIDASGGLVADVGVRPGASASVAMPRLLGTHQLIAWWQDRADQEYDLTWRLEQGRVGAGAAPMPTAAGPTRPSLAQEIPARGSVVVGTQDGRAIPLGLSVAPGVTASAGRLAARLGVLSLTVEVEREDATDVPVIVYLAPSGGYERERVPIVVRPGEPTAIVAAIPDCDSTCSSWDLVFGRPTDGERQLQVRISWEAVLRLWPLSTGGSAS